MMCMTELHGGVCHRTSTPHKSENNMKEKKICIHNIHISFLGRNKYWLMYQNMNSCETMTTGKCSIDDFRFKSILSQQRLTIDYQNISI